MSADPFFYDSATAQLVIRPVENRIAAANLECCRLLGLSIQEVLDTPVSHLFAPSFDRLVVFSEEILHRGQAWNDQLCIQKGEEVLRVGGTRMTRVELAPGPLDQARGVVFDGVNASRVDFGLAPLD